MIEIRDLVQSIGVPGFLQDAGYTTCKNGSGVTVGQRLLKEVFFAQQDMPEWFSDTVSLQWGHPKHLSASTKSKTSPKFVYQAPKQFAFYVFCIFRVVLQERFLRCDGRTLTCFRILPESSFLYFLSI